MATNDFEKRLGDAVKNYKSASKPLVNLLIEAVENFWQHSHSCGKIENYVNAIGAFPRLQAAAKTTFILLAPVKLEENKENGNFKVSVDPAFTKLQAETKKKHIAEYADELAAYKKADLNSILSRETDKETAFFTPVKLSKVTDTFATTAAKLMATAMLSDPKITKKDLIEKLTGALAGVIDSDIEKAKEAILKKKPLPPSKDELEKAATPEKLPA
ncbi:hypothetical protein [Serratia marcescens]|uniref:Uncharacterized protein n=1 Tax=Serratia marcescens TaxID=615 RepID=A0AAP8PGV0_SERMA|nr:hypothetical protein [Serratia marcescens]PNO65049.1 hypothetical protein MC70_017760 [Serratia marcescens]